jgi:ACS family sodium-dependent inorganic phosphate cotransporter
MADTNPIAGSRDGRIIDAPRGWQTRYTVALMCMAATFVCFIDRVNISVALIPMAEEFDWDYKTQSIVLSTFYVGYLLMQVGGGRLADRFGGALVLGIGVLVWSLFTFVTPWAAALGIYVLVLARIGMGLGEAVSFPSIYSMVTRWFPNTERSKAIALNASGVPLGTAFALLVTPIIVVQLGWQWAFYLFGIVGIVWYIAWRLLVTTTPQAHPSITSQELEYISAHAPTAGAAEEAPPWGKLLTNMPMWAIIVAHFTNNWTLYVILSWLPIYVNQGLGVDFASVGMISMLPHIASLVFLNICGNYADRLLAKGYNITRVRKTMQTVAFGGLAACLLMIPLVDSVWAAIGFMCLGKVFGALNMGGHIVNHMDIAPKHAGSLMGISNTAGTIPGIVAVFITGFILDSTGSWDLVWQTTAGVTLAGGLFYLIFASGEKQFD